MVISLIPLENFPNEFMAGLFSIIFILFILIELRIFIKNRRLITKDDKGSLLIILTSIFVSLSLLIILSFSSFGRINLMWSYGGLVVVVFGFGLRQWSIFLLKHFFTPAITFQKNHILIKKGPYKLIRHPSYTGLLLEIAGVGLFLSNWISSLISLFIMFLSLTYRIALEEKFLIKEFGKEYLIYMKETKKFIPFLY